MELFSFNADIVTAEIDHDLAHPEGPKYDANLLRQCSRLLHENFERTLEKGRPDPSLPYYPDALLYSHDSICYYLFGYFYYDPIRLNAFFMHYFIRGAVDHPVMYLSKIGRSMAVAYGPTVSLVSYACGPKIDVPHGLDYTQESLFKPRPQLREYPPGAAYEAALALAPRSQQRVNAYWVQVALYATRPLYRPLLLASLAILVACSASRSRHSARRRALRSHAALVVTLFSYNFLICLTVSMINVMDNVRYSQNQVAFTIFTLFSAVMLLLHAAYQLLARGTREPAGSPE